MPCLSGKRDVSLWKEYAQKKCMYTSDGSVGTCFDTHPSIQLFIPTQLLPRKCFQVASLPLHSLPIHVHPASLFDKDGQDVDVDEDDLFLAGKNKKPSAVSRKNKDNKNKHTHQDRDRSEDLAITNPAASAGQKQTGVALADNLFVTSSAIRPDENGKYNFQVLPQSVVLSSIGPGHIVGDAEMLLGTYAENSEGL